MLKNYFHKVTSFSAFLFVCLYIPYGISHNMPLNSSNIDSKSIDSKNIDSAAIKKTSNLPLNPLAKIIPPYTAEYTVLHKSEPAGTAIRKLEYLDDNRVNYSYETNVKWFIFSQERKESSIINTQNIKSIVPLSYRYTRTGTGKDKKYYWRYDAKNNKGFYITKDKEVTLDFNLALQDKLSYHLQHRINLINNANKSSYTYPVISTSGHVKDYVYQVDGTEELSLPYGVIKTIRLKREVKEKKRITYAWFAPELNYLMVKLYQIKDGSEQFEAQLTGLK